ncbi:MAG TPA: hypothetical protein VNL70_09860 [Tepidisphaeraceae bacterium]|nr:hypothetical protein [Tepidisphaeraceae bacterium]
MQEYSEVYRHVDRTQQKTAAISIILYDLTCITAVMWITFAVIQETCGIKPGAIVSDPAAPFCRFYNGLPTASLGRGSGSVIENGVHQISSMQSLGKLEGLGDMTHAA